MNTKAQEYAPNFLNNTSSIAGDVSTKLFQTVKIGQNAGSLASGQSNVFIGTHSAIQSINSSHCTFVGAYTGIANKNGSFNTIVGALSGIKIADGSNNTVCGYYSGNKISSGSFNTVFGAYTANGIENGNFNCVYGIGNASHMTHSYSNIFIGSYNATDDINRTSNNIIVGNNNALNDYTVNSIVLGNDCVTTSKSVVIGNNLRGDTENNIVIGSNVELINKGVITDPLVGYDVLINTNAKNRINMDITAFPQNSYNLIYTPYNVLNPPTVLSTTNSVKSVEYHGNIEVRTIDSIKLLDGLHSIKQFDIESVEHDISVIPVIYSVYIPPFINGPTDFNNNLIDLSQLYLAGFNIQYDYEVTTFPKHGYIDKNLYRQTDTIEYTRYPENFLELSDTITLSLHVLGTTRNNPAITLTVRGEEGDIASPRMLHDIYVNEHIVPLHHAYFNQTYYSLNSLVNVSLIQKETNVPLSTTSLNTNNIEQYALIIIDTTLPSSFQINGQTIHIHYVEVQRDIEETPTIIFTGIGKNYHVSHDISPSTKVFVEIPSNDGMFNHGCLFDFDEINSLVFSGTTHSTTVIRLIYEDNMVASAISNRLQLTIKSYIYRNFTQPLPNTILDDGYDMIASGISNTSNNVTYKYTIRHSRSPNLYGDLITDYYDEHWHTGYQVLNRQLSLWPHNLEPVNVTIYAFGSFNIREYIDDMMTVTSSSSTSTSTSSLYRVSLVEGALNGYVEGSYYSNLTNEDDMLKIAVTNNEYDYIPENVVTFNISVKNDFSVVVNDQYIYSTTGGETLPVPISITSPDPIYLDGVALEDMIVVEEGITEYNVSVGQPYHSAHFMISHKVIKDRYVFARDLMSEVYEINEVVYQLKDGTVAEDFRLSHEFSVSSLFGDTPLSVDYFEYSILLDDTSITIHSGMFNQIVYNRIYTVVITSGSLEIIEKTSKTVIYYESRNNVFSTITLKYNLLHNLINSPPDIVNYTLTLNILNLTLSTSVNDVSSHNLGVGKNIRTSGKNNICIGKDFDTFGNNSIIIGNNIGNTNNNNNNDNNDDYNNNNNLTEYDVGVHESIIIGNDCFNRSTAKNIISIGNNTMTDVDISTADDFKEISSFFKNNPILIGNDLSYNRDDPAIINIGGCFKEYSNRIEIDKADKKVVIDKLDLSSNTIIADLLKRIEVLENNR